MNTLSYFAGKWDNSQTGIILEQPVTLTVNNETWLTFMCTPSHLDELAAGFLYNEEIIETRNDIANIRVCPAENHIDVWLNRSVKKPEKWIRTSGCTGGETSIGPENPQLNKVRIHASEKLAADKIGVLIDLLGEEQRLYRKSGGVHTSALSDGERIIFAMEDIGRHNTLDKLAGCCILEPIHLVRKIILTTGRITSEMLQKARRIGAAVIISRTAPSNLAVQMAEMLGITLIGYARRDRFTVYAHPERIINIPAIVKVKSEAQ